MSKNRSRRQFDQSFKEDAVALVTEQGYSVSKAAESLGITTNMLYRWKEKLESDAGESSISEDERAELLRLRKENKELRMEKEILKKASQYFAKEMK